MAIVYQAADGRWIVFNNGIKSGYFTLESEARDMATKLIFTERAATMATSLAQLADDFSDLESVYFDRGYNSGGSNEIIDSDIVSLNITATQLGALVTLAQQLTNLFGNQPVSQQDYDATLNAIRTDI